MRSSPCAPVGAAPHATTALTVPDDLGPIPRLLRQTARVLAGSSALAGAWFLLEWIRGAGANLAFSSQQVPTAPATALLALEPWRAAAEERGFAASVAIPLSNEDVTFGALMIYAGEADAFDQSELDLLTAIGHDVSFGLGAYRNLESLRHQGEQLKLFRQAIDRSADAIFVADVKTGRFVDFNDACLTQVGYSGAELRAMGPTDIVVDMDARGGLETVANSVRAAGGIVRPSLHRHKDGREVPVEVALAVLDLGPRTLILGIARDISDRLAADADRQSLQEMRNRAQKMESIGRLAGGVAHDFNNLLTVINASAELAMRDAPADSSVERDLKEIRAAGDRAAALTRQLLAFSRQQVLRREVLSLNGVVTGAG